MKFCVTILMVTALLVIFGANLNDRSVDTASAQSSPRMSFFVSSAKSKTGNLGGLAAADRICQDLASAVRVGNKTWRAYLSVERDPATNQPMPAAGSVMAPGSTPKVSWWPKISPSCTRAREMQPSFSMSAANPSRASGPAPPGPTSTTS